MDTKEQIINLENRLIEAMKTSNVAELDTLIDDEVVFTNHMGQVLAKEADIEAHRSGNIEIYSLDPSEQAIRLFDDVAIVSVKKEISGLFFGETQVGIFRFTRVWKQVGSEWKVIAAHSTQLVH